MNHIHVNDATSTADLQDLAALDRLAGQLAPQAALRRYARQHQAAGSEPSRSRWRRLLTAVTHSAEQQQLPAKNVYRNRVSGGDAT